jgi:hypothetical protein
VIEAKGAINNKIILKGIISELKIATGRETTRVEKNNFLNGISFVNAMIEGINKIKG